MPEQDSKNDSSEKVEQKTLKDKIIEGREVLKYQDNVDAVAALDDWLDTSDENEILDNPNLLNAIVKEIGKKVVGEQDTIKVILLSCFGSLVENHSIASYNLLVNSESGSGKDHVVYSTITVLPRDMWVKRTRISPMLFTYWHNPKFEPEWTWDGKICYLEDISDNVLNADVFKTMCSSGSSATVLIKQVPTDIEIKGKPVMILTSANASPSAEITRRFSIVNLDESISQTSSIMERQANQEASGMTIEYNRNLTNALAKLGRVKVMIPYAKALTGYLPKESIIMRTHFQRFLDYIKSSCALYQRQRQQDENGSYVADGQDYDNARESLLKLTSNPLMIPLTHNDKKLMEIFKDLGQPASEKELEAKVSFLSVAQLFRILNKLSKYGFLGKDTREYEDSRKNCTVWALSKSVDASPLNIPTWAEIQKKLLKNDNDDNDDNDEND